MNEDQNTTMPGHLPVVPQATNVPIFVANRWVKTIDNELKKKYEFKTINEKRSFVVQLLNYELQTFHPIKLLAHELTVVLTLQTKDIDDVTDIDKEIAKYADLIYRDIIYK